MCLSLNDTASQSPSVPAGGRWCTCCIAADDEDVTSINKNNDRGWYECCIGKRLTSSPSYTRRMKRMFSLSLFACKER